jgi:hypothetical protein
LETHLIPIFWGLLLSRLNAVNKKLQSIEIDVVIVLEFYDSLIDLISSQREELNNYKGKALNRSTIKHYKTSVLRKKRTIQYDENRANDTELNGKKNFRINTFMVILDELGN